jgi:peptide/nickel transport system substrate-binding protein
MRRRWRLSVLAGLGFLAGLVVSVSLAGRVVVSPVREGGTLRVSLSGPDLASLDPAVAFDANAIEVLDATCAKLYGYVDRSGPPMLVAEVAAGPPAVSSDGRTYQFTVRPGFRFSDGSAVDASAFLRAFQRVRAPGLDSPGAAFVRDVTDVSASGQVLTITLARPAPDLVDRLAMDFFCAVPPSLPTTQNSLGLIPSAGPYYIAEHVPGSLIVLRRNPYYGGVRPNHLDAITIRLNTDTDANVAGVEKGAIDYDPRGPSETQYRALAARYGVNRRQFFVYPSGTVEYLTLNTSRSAFRDPTIRKAVAFALDRHALVAELGYLGAKPTDQILPPSIPGFHDANLYPLNQPDLARANQLMHGRKLTARLYVIDHYAQRGELIRQQLAKIGINVTVQPLDVNLLQQLIARPGQPFDMVLQGWTADYYDPYDFLNVMFSNNEIPPHGINNISRYTTPALQQQLNTAATLIGPARAAAYAHLDANLMRTAAPIVPFAIDYAHVLVSARVGCVVLHPNGLDLAATCLRR